MTGMEKDLAGALRAVVAQHEDQWREAVAARIFREDQKADFGDDMGVSIHLLSEAADALTALKHEATIANRNRDAARANFLTMQQAADTLRKRAEAAEARIRVLEEALRKSNVALDDWLNVYASDLCDEKRVVEAQDRIGELGTIGYIAKVTSENRSALEAKP